MMIQIKHSFVYFHIKQLLQRNSAQDPRSTNLEIPNNNQLVVDGESQVLGYNNNSSEYVKKAPYEACHEKRYQVLVSSTERGESGERREYEIIRQNVKVRPKK